MVNPIFLILPDPLMAVGIQVLASKLNLHLICLDDHPVLRLLENQGLPTFALKHHHPQTNIKRTAAQILSQPPTLKYIRNHTPKNSTSQIAVFKSSLQVETFCSQHHFRILANTYHINRQFEDKTRFYQLLPLTPEIQPHLLPFQISPLSDIKFPQLSKLSPPPYVLQFGRGWAGNSTLLLNHPSQLSRLQSRWPNRVVKITPFTPGITLINNACITSNQVFISPPALQISSSTRNQKLDTRNLFTTLGRQWPAPVSSLIINQINRLTNFVSQTMIAKGYRGFFGLDFLLHPQTHRLYLLECNPRITASFGFYTQLESSRSSTTLLEHHFNSFSVISKPQVRLGDEKSHQTSTFLNQKLETKNQKPATGSQLSVRNLGSQPLRVANQLIPGIYTYRYNQLKYLHSDLDFNKNNPNQFLLLPPKTGRLISPNQLLFLISSLSPLADHQGVVTPQTQQLIQTVTSQLVPSQKNFQ